MDRLSAKWQFRKRDGRRGVALWMSAGGERRVFWNPRQDADSVCRDDNWWETVGETMAGETQNLCLSYRLCGSILASMSVIVHRMRTI